jgi:capsule polysaccharide export protein KpsE/RkpR
MYIGFLKSRTIGDDIIDRFKLRQVYKKKTMYELRKKLQAASDIESGKDGLIHIAVKDHDPNRASEIANAYVDELYKMNSNVAITEAAQRRAFFNQQLTEEKNALASAEDDFRNTELKTGVIQLGGQAVEVIRRIAEMRAEIASREVQLQSLRTYATDQNPDVTRLQQEIGAMRAQLSKLESSQQEEPGNTSVPAGQVPEASLEYARKLRELKYHESLYELLAKQLEAARIDEAKSAPIIQVIDRAVPPDHKSGPPRLLLILGITCVGLASAIAWVLLSQSFLRLRHTGDSKHKLDELSSMFKERIV